MTAEPAIRTDWPEPGAASELRVLKLHPDGHVVTEYPGTLVPGAAPAPWVCVRATWTHRLVAMDGLEFHPGDVLMEYFSPERWFNVFAVHEPGPDGALRGWYANVTYPTAYDPATDPPTLTWHDLYLDVVAVPGGRVTVRDEDELEDSGLERTDPRLHRRVVEALDEILRALAAGAFPFAAPGGGNESGTTVRA